MVTLRSSLLLLCAAALLAACSDTVGPEPEGELRASAYFWSNGASSATYVSDRNGRVEQHLLRFTGTTIIDTRYDEFSTVLAETSLQSVTRNGARELTGCSIHSLMALPPYLRFKDDIQTQPGQAVHATGWQQLSNSSYLVASRNKLFEYHAMSSEWTEEPVPWTSDIVTMAVDSSIGESFIYVATRSDGIFRRATQEKNWLLIASPPGDLEDAAVDKEGVIFAVIKTELRIARPPYDEWPLFTVSELASDVSCIELEQVTAAESILLVGSMSNGISEVLLVAGWPAQLSVSTRFGSARITDISSSVYSPYIGVAISNPPQLHVSPIGVGNWAVVPITGSSPLTCVSQSNRSAAVLIGTESGLLRFDGAPTSASGLTGEHILSLEYGYDGSFYCGTTNGSYRSLDEGRKWNRIDEQGTIVRETTGFTLLPETFSVASTWDAGTLLFEGAGELRLTGRVLSHFDELILPDNAGRFDDVIVVRYAPEDASGSVAAGQYSWTAHYARNIGLVYIEEMENGAVVASTHFVQP